MLYSKILRAELVSNRISFSYKLLFSTSFLLLMFYSVNRELFLLEESV